MGGKGGKEKETKTLVLGGQKVDIHAMFKFLFLHYSSEVTC